MAKELQISITIEEYSTLNELPQAEQALMLQAQEAAANAYAPYSNFLVGAALLFTDGTTLAGNNQENAAYPSGLCAERVALFAKGALMPEAEVKALAITARKRDSQQFLPVSSCGACRQVMAEYEGRQGKPIRVIMPAEDGRYYVCRSVADLLPLQFSNRSLSI